MCKKKNILNTARVIEFRSYCRTQREFYLFDPEALKNIRSTIAVVNYGQTATEKGRNFCRWLEKAKKLFTTLQNTSNDRNKQTKGTKVRLNPWSKRKTKTSEITWPLISLKSKCPCSSGFPFFTVHVWLA